MLKENMPINNAINTWSAENYPADWASQRDQWLYFFRLRQIVNITRFLGLLIGVVFA
jgi:tetrahydromethanopterin S-methyltransferase subunit F